MHRPGRSPLVDAIVRAAERPTGGLDGHGGAAEPPHDVVAVPVELPGGPIRLLRPRDPEAVAFETVSAPGAAVEELHPPHWARLWASGIALAHAIEPDPSDATGPDGEEGGANCERAGRPGGRIVVRGRPVLELGCGLGLPALAAARAGARVLATDRSPGAVAYVAASAAREGIGLCSAACAWDGAGSLVEQGPWDVVLAADVIYDQEALTVLASLLTRLVADDGEVWLTDPRRPLAAEFLADARGRWREVDTRASAVPGVLLHRLRGPVRPVRSRRGGLP